MKRLTSALLRPFVSKLGRCPTCIRLSVFLAFAGWALVLVTAASPHPWSLRIAVFAALPLTSLTVAHMVALYLRIVLRMRQEREGCCGRKAERPESAYGRREFLGTSVRMTLAVLLPLVALPRSARAQLLCFGRQDFRRGTTAAAELCGVSCEDVELAATIDPGKFFCRDRMTPLCRHLECSDPQICVGTWAGGSVDDFEVLECVETGVKCGPQEKIFKVLIRVAADKVTCACACNGL